MYGAARALPHLQEKADTRTSYAHLLAGTRRCHSHVHSREYFLEAMEVCLKQNGRRKPSAVSFGACVVLLRAAASVRDGRMHDIVSSWMLFKWPDRRSEIEAIPLHRFTVSGVAAAAKNAAKEHASKKRSTTARPLPNSQDPGQNKATVAEGKNQEKQESKSQDAPANVSTPFVRTSVWISLRSFLSEKDEVCYFNASHVMFESGVAQLRLNPSVRTIHCPLFHLDSKPAVFPSFFWTPIRCSVLRN